MPSSVGEAVKAAFRSAPASLAACRVVARLADSVRGVDPRSVDVGRTLGETSGFRVLTSAALARLSGP